MADAPDQPVHIPVMTQEVLRALDPRPGETALDCTVGQGGHASLMAQRIGPAGTLIANDFDAVNLDSAARRVESLPGAPRIVKLQGNFADLPRKLTELGLSADVVIADLGFASGQLEDPSRGLSFSREGPLDMRLDPSGASGATTAADLVNTLPTEELAEIIRDFGEERYARRIAEKLVAERGLAPINTTTRLAQIVRSVVGASPGRSRIDPATRTFQALRIAVNDELGNLRSLLESIGRTAAANAGSSRQAPGAAGRPQWLAPGSRIVFIAFHSLEDRLVKRACSDWEDRGLARAIGRQPLEPSAAESAANPRARSAKLRAVRLGSA